jgi:hypothetical protein
LSKRRGKKKTDPLTIEIIGKMLRASAEEIFLTCARVFTDKAQARRRKDYQVLRN